jgi:hypothetical protein
MTATAPTPPAADAYTRSLFDALGDQDPLAVLAVTPAAVEAIVRSVDDATLRRPEREGKWSMLQVVRHFADVEVAQSWRFRMVLAEEAPAIQAWDQDLWMARLWSDDPSLDDVLAQWKAARAANLRVLRTVQGDEWQRAGLHSERGSETLRFMVDLTAGHDLVHRRQLERIRAAVTAS